MATLLKTFLWEKHLHFYLSYLPLIQTHEHQSSSHRKTPLVLRINQSNQNGWVFRTFCCKGNKTEGNQTFLNNITE